MKLNRSGWCYVNRGREWSQQQQSESQCKRTKKTEKQGINLRKILVAGRKIAGCAENGHG